MTDNNTVFILMCNVEMTDCNVDYSALGILTFNIVVLIAITKECMPTTILSL